MNEDMLNAQAVIRGSLEGCFDGRELVQRRSSYGLRAATCKEDSIVRASNEKSHGANLGSQVGIGVREKDEVVRTGEVVQNNPSVERTTIARRELLHMSQSSTTNCGEVDTSIAEDEITPRFPKQPSSYGNGRFNMNGI